MNDESESAGGAASGDRRPFKPVQALSFSVFAGAVLAILVAWAIALQAEPSFVSGPVVFQWPGRCEADWPTQPTSISVFSARWGPGGLEQRSAWGAHDGSMRADFRMWVTESGWPAPALRSTLRARNAEWFWGAGLYDNDSSFQAGLVLPLHHGRPHDAGPEGWGSRRLPLEPMPLGFAAGTAFWGALAFGLLVLRWLAGGAREGWRRRWLKRAFPLLLGLVVNLAVAFGLWARWQFGSKPLEFPMRWPRPGASSALNATELAEPVAVWPVDVPVEWSQRPEWIGWHGAVLGVQACQYTSRGIPVGALGWYFVTWGPGAFDVCQQVHIVQIGWPLPCLQSEELIDDAPPGAPATSRPGGRFASPLVRAGAVLDVTLPGAPIPASGSHPAPFLPVRPLALGMVLNTLLFGAGIALLVSAPGALQALRRRVTGRCRKCGYDVQSLPRCPECGLLQAPREYDPLSDETFDRAK